LSPLLAQFLSEARELLQGIGEKLMLLEESPSDELLMKELFRLVHTLKGNSGLFDFPEMTRVLHAGEDLLAAVRDGRVAFSRSLDDVLLNGMDFVGLLCDEIESKGASDGSRAEDSVRLAAALRAPIPFKEAAAAPVAAPSVLPSLPPKLADIPEAVRAEALRLVQEGHSLHWVDYAPAEGCFFKGDDPFHTARLTPGLLWGAITAREAWPALSELNAYKCILDFHILTTAPREILTEHFRYVPEQLRILAVAPTELGVKEAALDPAAAAALEAVLDAQRDILLLDDRPAWQAGRIKAVAGVLMNCCKGEAAAQDGIKAALESALASGESGPLLAWLDARDGKRPPRARAKMPAAAAPEAGIKFGRRAEDNAAAPTSLKVEQVKIDRLMNLIGEILVSKNELPYIAQKAEGQFGSRELAREIKAHYAVTNRIALEMQDAIMQVRMMPVSFVFQRFPRMVRDISRKLGKDVRLVLEGEETEADKNIIESLADPLVHIVRNSLDHGIESPEERRAAGKPETGTLTIRASQEADRVLIEILDDGKGIDPAAIKRKAFEKGFIDEATMNRINDRDALNLVFAAGLSTTEVASDLSGRGVGMDVVRSAVEKINGSVVLESEVGKGTSIRISLPLSIAVTRVMVIECDAQLFGVPMDDVVETVRIARSAMHGIKQSATAVLRGRIVALKALNGLLKLPSEPRANADDELAVLLARVGDEEIGLLVDDFRETIDVIQKPLGGILSGIPAYSGSALMGDGSVLMLLNLKEVV
jgi:two-component system chemotaxis sensor kinase CheA